MNIFSGSYAVSGGSCYFCLFHSWITTLYSFFCWIFFLLLKLIGNCFAVPNCVSRLFIWKGILGKHLFSYFLLPIEEKIRRYFILVLIYVCIAIIVLLLSLELESSGKSTTRDVLGAPQGFEILAQANT